MISWLIFTRISSTITSLKFPLRVCYTLLIKNFNIGVSSDCSTHQVIPFILASNPPDSSFCPGEVCLHGTFYYHLSEFSQGFNRGIQRGTRDLYFRYSSPNLFSRPFSSTRGKYITLPAKKRSIHAAMNQERRNKASAKSKSSAPVIMGFLL